MASLFNHPNLPILLSGFQYENPLGLMMLLDFTGKKVKIIDLKDYGVNNFNSYLKLDNFKFTDKGVEIIIPKVDHYNFSDLVKKLGLEDIQYDSKKIEEKRTEIEDYVKKQGTYQEIYCFGPSLGQGSADGCYGLKTVNRYLYTSENGMQIVH